MSTVPSADAKAVVRAAEALTTQVRRIADALTMPVVEEVRALDDDATTTVVPDFTSPIAGRIEVRQPCPYCGDRQMIPRRQFDEHVARLHPDVRTGGPGIPVPPAEETGPAKVISHWLPVRDQLAEERQELAGMVGEFIDAQVRQARADEEQTLRWTRRESLLVLLTRLQRGRTLSEQEAGTLRHHVETEIREADYARSRVEATYQTLDARTAERDTADRIRAEAQRDRDQHAAVLAEVLRHFTMQTGDPDDPRVRTPWVPTNTVDRWRSVVAPTVERPWWVDVAEIRAELKETQAAIERVRGLTVRAAQTTAAGISDYDIGRHELAVEVYTALDGTEQTITAEDDEGLRAKVDEATAALQRAHAVGAELEYAATGIGLAEPAREAMRDASRRIRSALAGPHDDDAEQPTTKET
ncbi:hypothetical protein [Streptomyces sp. NPDC058694]|uniref:hypothetical protein n=1 Tax=Streptomyces sp. NPDC058694 TaxID=3346603 RepID=UPI00365306FA